MADKRKLQTEIDRTLKKVEEGVNMFDEIWEKVYAARDPNHKEKFEQDLKKEIKKLQRHRDQIKTWLSGNDVKDKKTLTDARKLIETKMEQFKVCEKEAKTKMFSKEGLAREQKIDPQEAAKNATRDWLQEAVEKLNRQMEAFDADLERLSSGKGRQRNKDEMAHLEENLSRHRRHVAKLELITRLMDNDHLDPASIDEIKEDVEYFVESNSEPDYQPTYDDEEEMYAMLDLDDAPIQVVDLHSTLKRSPRDEGDEDFGLDDEVEEEKPTKGRKGKDVGRGAKGKEAAVPAATKAAAVGRAGNGLAATARAGGGGGKAVAPVVVTPRVVPAPLALGKGGLTAAQVAQRGLAVDTSDSADVPKPGLTPTGPTLAQTLAAQQQQQQQATAAPPQLPTTPLPQAQQKMPTPVLQPQPAPAPAPILQPQAPTPTPQQVSAQQHLAQAAAVQQQQQQQQQEERQQQAAVQAQQTALLQQQTAQQQALQQQQSALLERQRQAAVLQQQQQQVQQTPPQQPAPSPLQQPILQPQMKLSPQIGMMMGLGGPGPASSIAVQSPSPQGSPPSMAAAQQILQAQRPQQAPALISRLPSAQQQQQQQPILGLQQQLESFNLAPAPPEPEPEPLAPPTPMDPQTAPGGAAQKTAPETLQMQMNYLNMAMLYIPTQHDSERPKQYFARNPYPVNPSYPTTPAPIFETPAIFEKLGTDTLFFIFYYQQGTYQQYLAAKELKKQSWRFHKKYMTWFQRHEEPKITTDEFEQGTYVYFDCESGWCTRIKQEFTFCYEHLEASESE